LAQYLTPWAAIDGQRIAAASAFGIAGTNAHLIVSVPEVA
jgi:mycobactin polyketide synthetase MbtC